MTDRPLGIHDLFLDGDLEAPTVHELPDCWYWCRRHERAIQASKVCKGAGGYLPTGDLPGDGCIRIGPFMSECEANRLGAIGYIGSRPALGMEVE